jgi:hypothetical protein
MTSAISTSPTLSAQSNVVALPQRTRDERKQAVTEFVRGHPGLSLAGGLLAGVLFSRLLPRKPVRKLAGKATALSELAGAAALTLGRRAIEQAGAAGSELRARGGSLAGHTENLSEAAARRVGSLGHEAAERIEKLGEAAASRLSKAGITTDKIEKLSEAAVSGVGKVTEAAAAAGSAAIERAGELLAPAEAKVEDVVKRIAQTASDLREKVRT